MDVSATLIIAMTLALAFLAARHMPLGHLRLALSRPQAAPARFPSVLTPQAHWQKATSIVELSLARAATMAACQDAAKRQLEAADYALHLLLDDLAQVMSIGITSPLDTRGHRADAIVPAARTAAALAA